MSIACPLIRLSISHASHVATGKSTRPRGARLEVVEHRVVLLRVSIHAPAWGATRRSPSAWGRRTGFNPRARVGRDRHTGQGTNWAVGFQSTRPRGARHPSIGLAAIAKQFQSTRPRGARRPMRRHRAPRRSFNPRARVGRDSSGRRSPLCSTGFNPRARVGRDSTPSTR